MSAALDQPDARVHSALGASGAYRWLACPGSFGLSRRAPGRPASSYAAAGTLAHDLVELGLTKGPAALEQLRDSVITIEGHAVTVDDDFIAGITVMLEYVVDRTRDPDTEVQVETSVFLDRWFKNRMPPPVRLFGRADVLLYEPEPRLLEIVDYKNGAGVLVVPENNPQLLYYAAGAVVELERRGRHPATIRMTVVQPNASGVAKIRSTDIDFVDLIIWVQDVLIPGVHACTAEDAPLNTGDHCRFCPASVQCPALRLAANEMAKHDFSDCTLPDTPENLAQALNDAEIAEAWIEAVRGYALEQLKAQVNIPGWTMVPTRPVRRWTDPAAIERITMMLGFGEAAFRHELHTPAQMEKLARKRGIDWESQFNRLVEHYSSGMKLARRNPTDFSPTGDEPC
jgi:hypothetical protein